MKPAGDKLFVHTDGAFPEAAENLVEGAVKDLVRDVPGGVLNQVLSLLSNDFRALMAFLGEIRAHSFDARVIEN